MKNKTIIGYLTEDKNVDFIFVDNDFQIGPLLHIYYQNSLKIRTLINRGSITELTSILTDTTRKDEPKHNMPIDELLQKNMTGFLYVENDGWYYIENNTMVDLKKTI